ncbi:MAG: adenylate/guanylate cyclase domain-containing protein [Planctomycetaceae bacterium]|nr:adenylate/guanylate cyclase domain-containing protein [Planctomycetaceae bacterium]
MTAPLQIRVYENHELIFSDEFEGIVELGRQNETREALFSKRFDAGRWRLVIANLDEDMVSRRHALLEPISESKIKLTNTSAVIPLRYQGGELRPRSSGEVSIPTVLTIGRKMVRVQGTDDADLPVQGLAEATLAPGRYSNVLRLPALEMPSGTGVEVESLVRWLQAIVGVLQTATSSPDFFQRASQAVVEIVGLDTGRVLLLDQESWRVESVNVASGQSPERNWRPSHKVLGRLRQEKRTLWQEPDGGNTGLEGGSLMGLSSVVTSPILNRQGEVIGALYGERRQGGRATSTRIMKIDAMLMELLASGVAAGLARIEQEKAALAARVQFEQFFTPALAQELAVRPDLLNGRDLEVTMLFCDVRGFSRISVRLGPSGTVAWISDVMAVLSDCVDAHQGVLVDYIGDELIAMWGAPKEEPRQAQLACSAALEMLHKLGGLNARWKSTLGEEMSIGIGVNTGRAQVGNTGSPRKFKYGALGPTVNLASRVEGATKYLKTKLLITSTTQNQLEGCFPTRRLCKVEVVNIAEPVDLYELAPPGQPGWAELQQSYERGLTAFEGREFRSAAQILGNLLSEHPDDGPSLVLLSRAVTCLIDPALFDPVWKLPGK